MNLTFDELPTATPKKKGARAWLNEAAALQASPGRWAHFEDFDGRTTADKSAFTQNLKRGILLAFSNGKFEARVIQGQVWARYVGPTA